MPEVQIKSLLELTVEVEGLKTLLTNINNPSSEYLASLEAAINTVVVNIQSLTAVVNAAKKQIESFRDTTIDSINTINNELITIIEPKVVYTSPKYDVTPSITTARVEITPLSGTLKYEVEVTNIITQQTILLETYQPSITVAGLSSNTNYKVRVLAISATGEKSEEPIVQYFTTLKNN